MVSWGHRNVVLRGAPRKYRLNLEIAKKIEFLQIRPEWSPTGTSYKNIVLSSLNHNFFFYDFFLFDALNRPKSIEMSGKFSGS